MDVFISLEEQAWNVLCQFWRKWKAGGAKPELQV
jgi:hypothetical protein